MNKNLNFAEIDLKVSYINYGITDYEENLTDTKIIDEKALYEPGYVQVVYLKIENETTVPFDFYTSVNVTDYTHEINVYGVTFNLQNYLEFGILTEKTEAEITEKLESRDLANSIDFGPLSSYSTTSVELEAEGEAYAAIVLRMKETVGNVANYRGDDIPKVELGVIVSATQKTN